MFEGERVSGKGAEVGMVRKGNRRLGWVCCFRMEEIPSGFESLPVRSGGRRIHLLVEIANKTLSDPVGGRTKRCDPSGVIIYSLHLFLPTYHPYGVKTE
jgi:hypothetical protein